jgi:hypothetical protein
MKKGLIIFFTIVVAVAALTAYEHMRNSAIEEIPSRDRSLKLDVNNSKILYAIEHGQEYDGAIFDDTYTWVSRRFDASDFRLQSLARILYEHKGKITDAEYQTIKKTFTEFKYWMDQPGTDGMCYWSENHQLLFAASEFLAGQYWPDDTFTNMGITGLEHTAMAKERLLIWLEQRWLYGFTEWYSNTYYVEDIAPLANLIDFADDEEIVIKATIILDLLLYDLASQSYKGTFIASSGRMYANGKRYGENNSMQAVSDSIWDPARWGHEPSNRIGMDYNFVTINNYSVPPVIKAIGEDDSRTVITKATNGLNLTELADHGLNGTAEPQIMMQWAMEAFSNDLVIENTVAYLDKNNMFGNDFLHDFKTFNLSIFTKTGLLPLVSRMLNPISNGVAIQRANTYNYKTPDYMLTTAQAYHPGSFGDQQHLWNATLSRTVSVFTTHPAKPLPDNGRVTGSPNYWVGGGRFPHVVQNENVVLNIFDLPTEPTFMEKSVLAYTHAHFPSQRFDQIVIEDNYAFGRVGDTYAVLIGKNSLNYVDGSDDDLIQQGRNTFWIFEAGSKTEDNSFDDFITRIKSNPIIFENNQLTYTSNSNKLDLNYQENFIVNEAVQNLEYTRFDSPYIKSEREPQTMSFEHKGKSLYLDFYKMIRTYQ